MSEPFPVNEYWIQRGRTYAGEPRLAQAYHRLQEHFLLQQLQTLQAHQAPLGRILELGCGFGRITRLLAQTFPQSRITAVDLSPDQLQRAREYCQDMSHVDFQPYDFYSGAPFPGAPCDLVIAVEVFLHHPPEFIQSLFQRLSRAAPILVHLDWFEPWSGPLPPHVWIHDYPQLHRQQQREFALLPVPEKVDGKQQTLFVAAPSLPEPLRAASRNVPAPTAAPADNAHSWEHRVAQATRDLCQTIPPGASFILVAGQDWGVRDFPDGRQARPLIEKEGADWGPPADSADAIRAVRDAAARGIRWLVLPWNAFWWRDHYEEWFASMNEQHACTLNNDRLIVFNLADTQPSHAQ